MNKRAQYVERWMKGVRSIEEKSIIDNTRMNAEILVVLVFKCTKLFVTTMIASYFVGMLWFICVQIIHNYLEAKCIEDQE